MRHRRKVKKYNISNSIVYDVARMRYERELRGWSKRKFAEIIGVHESLISQVENGHVKRSPGTIKASLRGMQSVYRMDTIAAQFGGGGHANAAGLNWPGTLAEFYPRLIGAITQRLNEVDAALQ